MEILALPGLGLATSPDWLSLFRKQRANSLFFLSHSARFSPKAFPAQRLRGRVEFREKSAELGCQGVCSLVFRFATPACGILP
jgi:hypothetical protein